MLRFFLLVLLTASLIGCELFSDEEDSTSLEPLNELFPVLLNGQWGYINSDGALVVSPQFDEARTSVLGISTYRSGNLWGYFSASSKEKLTEAIFSQAFDFTKEGLALVRTSDGAWAYINREGSIEINTNYEFARSFSEGFAAIRSGSQWGFIDIQGQEVVEPTYSSLGDFSNGLTAILGADGWGYLDMTGKLVINPSFEVDELGRFSNELAPVKTAQGWGYLNKDGALAIPIQYEEAASFSGGMALVKKDDYFGFINTEGVLIISPQFEDAKSFQEGRAAIEMNNRWFFIEETKGRLIRSSAFIGVDSFLNGFARIWVGNGDNPSFGYIDKDGNYLWNPTK